MRQILVIGCCLMGKMMLAQDSLSNLLDKEVNQQTAGKKQLPMPLSKALNWLIPVPLKQSESMTLTSGYLTGLVILEENLAVIKAFSDWKILPM